MSESACVEVLRGDGKLVRVKRPTSTEITTILTGDFKVGFPVDNNDGRVVIFKEGYGGGIFNRELFNVHLEKFFDEHF